ncbi:MAG: HAMP domain-containing histidine kinase, partial [Thermoproteota archaeon]|nr:HAMP domain-containing histidine kinase [Thermoproteota archaeon]
MIEVESIRKERFAAAKDRGVKFRYVTEITKDNLSYCKEMLKFASEIRHLDGVKGNFEVSDEKEYVAATRLQQDKEQPIPQLIYSNVKEIVEQQQYVFDSFWNRAIPSEQKIREIDYGIMPEVTEIIQNPKEAEKLEWDLLRKAKKEVFILYSTDNAFYIQESTGTIDFLNQLAEEGISVKVLTPTDDYITKSIEKLKQQQQHHRRRSHNYHHNQEQQQLQKQQQNQINVNHDNNINIIEFRNIASTLGIKIKSLVVDRKYSLIMELKDNSKETISTAAALGWSTYSNSQATVLSYVSIFETLWRQTELYEQLQQADRIKTEFINIAAHELRTPIMPIIGYAEMLEEELGHNEKRKESLTAIIRNAKRLQRLADDILDVTRIESKTLNINKEQLNLNDLILNVLDDIVINTKEEELKAAGNNNISNSNSNSISSNNNRRKFLYKASEEDIIIQGDRIRLIQVISNLIDNAIKFTKQEKGGEGEGGSGGGTISIIVDKKKKENIINNDNKNTDEGKKEKEEEEEVIVSIKDTGTGIASEILPRLF